MPFLRGPLWSGAVAGAAGGPEGLHPDGGPLSPCGAGGAGQDQAARDHPLLIPLSHRLQAQHEPTPLFSKTKNYKNRAELLKKKLLWT